MTEMPTVLPDANVNYNLKMSTVDAGSTSLVLLTFETVHGVFHFMMNSEMARKVGAGILAEADSAEMNGKIFIPPSDIKLPDWGN